MQNRDRMFYQYALLNLAILQADFGSYSEAVAAMQEAISTAREHKDMNCLNFCLSWLYHFGKAFPNETHDIHKSGMLGTEKEGLAFLKAKAKESEMWSLLSTSLLSEAKLGLQNVRPMEWHRDLSRSGTKFYRRARALLLSSKTSSKHPI
jgi:anaphase-promoting complex subunit 5